MIVLKANEEQWSLLNGWQKGVSKLVFVKDGGDNWIAEMAILSDDTFIDIREELMKLERIEFVQRPELY
jgi:hypothetical protein